MNRVDEMLEGFNFTPASQPVLFAYMRAATEALEKAHDIYIDGRLCVIRDKFNMARGHCTPYYAQASDISEAFLCAVAIPFLQQKYNPHSRQKQPMPIHMKFMVTKSNCSAVMAQAIKMEIQSRRVSEGSLLWDRTYNTLDLPTRMMIDLDAAHIAREALKATSALGDLFAPDYREISINRVRTMRLRLKGHDSALAMHFHSMADMLEARLTASNNASKSGQVVTFGRKSDGPAPDKP